MSSVLPDPKPPPAALLSLVKLQAESPHPSHPNPPGRLSRQPYPRSGRTLNQRILPNQQPFHELTTTTTIIYDQGNNLSTAISTTAFLPLHEHFQVVGNLARVPNLFLLRLQLVSVLSENFDSSSTHSPLRFDKHLSYKNIPASFSANSRSWTATPRSSRRCRLTRPYRQSTRRSPFQRSISLFIPWKMVIK